jgi:hypothetical protein
MVQMTKKKRDLTVDPHVTRDAIIEEHGCEWGDISVDGQQKFGGFSLVVQGCYRRGELIDFRRLKGCIRALTERGLGSKLIIPVELFPSSWKADLADLTPGERVRQRYDAGNHFTGRMGFADKDYEDFIASFERTCVACRDAEHATMENPVYRSNEDRRFAPEPYTAENRYENLANTFAQMSVYDATGTDDDLMPVALHSFRERADYNRAMHALLVHYGLLKGLRETLEADLKTTGYTDDYGRIALKRWARPCIDEFLIEHPLYTWVDTVCHVCNGMGNTNGEYCECCDGRGH